MAARLASFALLVAFLAGCSSPSTTPDPAATDPTSDPMAAPEAATPRVVSKSGHLDAGVGASTEPATCWVEVGADRVLDVTVPEGTRMLVLELAWDDALQDLTLVARPPASDNRPCMASEGDMDGFTGSPDGMARFVVADPTPGVWTVGAQANGVVAQSLDYVLYGTTSRVDLAEGYTAVAAQ